MSILVLCGIVSYKIDSKKNPHKVSYIPPRSTTDTTPTWQWSSARRVDHYELRLNDGEPFTTKNLSFTPKNSLEIGTHKLEVVSVSRFGKRSRGRSYEMIVYSTRGLNSFKTNLPIITIDTFGKPIVNEPKIAAQMNVIYDNSGRSNSLMSKNVDFTGRIGIEIRGYSSKRFPKKQYAFEVWDDKYEDKDVSLLGMPPESDWVLNGPYSDKSLIRNHLAFELSRELGYYTPRNRFVELFLNDNQSERINPDHYLGVYLLIEKIKRGKQRVNIKRNSISNDRGKKLSGGYLLELNRYKRLGTNDRIIFSTLLNNSSYFVLKYPKRINKKQRDWIKDYLDGFERSLQEIKAKAPVHDYKDFINVNNFIDYMLLQELLKNQDAFFSSTYLYKERNEKLNIGPVWDHNISMGNSNYSTSQYLEGWQLKRRMWAKDLLQDHWFVTRYIEQWRKLRSSVLSTENILSKIDQATALLAQAQERNFERWPILGYYVWPNRSPLEKSYEDEISFLKQWLTDRSDWIDKHIDELLIMAGKTGM